MDPSKLFSKPSELYPFAFSNFYSLSFSTWSPRASPERDGVTVTRHIVSRRRGCNFTDESSSCFRLATPSSDDVPGKDKRENVAINTSGGDDETGESALRRSFNDRIPPTVTFKHR
jgi:hypothetical protein